MQTNNIERGIEELKSELEKLQKKHDSFANNMYLAMFIGGLWLLTILVRV
jgi:hypothetical protein